LNVPYIYLHRTCIYGWVVLSTCRVWPCFFIGVSLDCLSMLVSGHRASA